MKESEQTVQYTDKSESTTVLRSFFHFFSRIKAISQSKRRTKEQESAGPGQK